jgi:ribonuclease HI
MSRNGASAPRPKHLFTDASCIRQRGIASWAGMLLDGFDSHLQAGLIGQSLKDSTQAEAIAVRTALRLFLRRRLIVPGDTILVHCDNQDVVKHLDRGMLLPRASELALEFLAIRETMEQHKLALCARWIKAHQGPDAACWRSLINQRVDREAIAVTKAENRRRLAEGDKGRVKKEFQIGRDPLAEAAE